MQRAGAVAAPAGGSGFDFFEHAADVIFDVVQGGQNLGDALADQVLEIASFENLDHRVLNVLRQILLEPAAERGGQIVGGRVDLFGGGKNLLRRALGAFDHR